MAILYTLTCSIGEHHGYLTRNTAHKRPLGTSELKLHTNRAEPQQVQSGVEDALEQTAAAVTVTNGTPANNVMQPRNVRVPCSNSFLLY